MRLVRQDNHETCQQACIAMLAGVTLDQVVQIVGDHALGMDERRKAFEHFGIAYPQGESGFVVGQVENPLVRLIRDHRLLWCSVACVRDGSYGHAVLIYDRHMYDPWRGIDQDWPWTRHIWKAMPIERAPCLKVA